METQFMISVLPMPKCGVVILPLRDLKVDARCNSPEADEDVCDWVPELEWVMDCCCPPWIAVPSAFTNMFPLTTAARARSSRIPLPQTKQVAMNLVTFMHAST